MFKQKKTSKVLYLRWGLCRVILVLTCNEHRAADILVALALIFHVINATVSLNVLPIPWPHTIATSLKFLSAKITQNEFDVRITPAWQRKNSDNWKKKGKEHKRQREHVPNKLLIQERKPKEKNDGRKGKIDDSQITISMGYRQYIWNK